MIPQIIKLGVDFEIRHRLTSQDYKSAYEDVAKLGPSNGFSNKDWNDLDQEGNYYSEANLHLLDVYRNENIADFNTLAPGAGSATLGYTGRE